MLQRSLRSGQYPQYLQAVDTVRYWFRTVRHAIKEMLTFQLERFNHFYRRDENISIPDSILLSIREIFFRVYVTLVVYTQFLARFYIVKDRHLLSRHDSELADLVRVEPASLSMPHHVIGKI